MVCSWMLSRLLLIGIQALALLMPLTDTAMAPNPMESGSSASNSNASGASSNTLQNLAQITLPHQFTEGEKRDIRAFVNGFRDVVDLSLAFYANLSLSDAQPILSSSWPLYRCLFARDFASSAAIPPRASSPSSFNQPIVPTSSMDFDANNNLASPTTFSDTIPTITESTTMDLSAPTAQSFGNQNDNGIGTPVDLYS